MIAVYASKGGCGTTFVTANLAASQANDPDPVDVSTQAPWTSLRQGLAQASVMTANVFIGTLMLESIRRLDVPVVQGVVLVFAVIYVVVTMLADILNALLDPRIRYD